MRRPTTSPVSLVTSPPASEDIRPEEVLDVRVERVRPELTVVHARGEIDMFTTPLLSDAIEKQFAQERCRVLVVNMLSVTFLSSNGLASLVEAQRMADSCGVTLRLVGTTRAVTRPLESTGILSMFDVHRNLDSATR